LVGNPDLEQPGNPMRVKIIALAEKVAHFDPEFILKVNKKQTKNIF
jgi:hypothetical protein